MIKSVTASAFEILVVSSLQLGGAMPAHRDVPDLLGGDTGHPQGLWLLWLLALCPWDCSHISTGTLLAAVRISFSRSLEANHTF